MTLYNSNKKLIRYNKKQQGCATKLEIVYYKKEEKEKRIKNTPALKQRPIKHEFHTIVEIRSGTTLFLNFQLF